MAIATADEIRLLLLDTATSRAVPHSTGTRCMALLEDDSLVATSERGARRWSAHGGLWQNVSYAAQHGFAITADELSIVSYNPELGVFHLKEFTAGLPTQRQVEGLHAPDMVPLGITSDTLLGYHGDELFRIDVPTGKLTSTSSLPARYRDVVLTRDGSKLYGIADGRVHVVDMSEVQPMTEVDRFGRRGLSMVQTDIGTDDSATRLDVSEAENLLATAGDVVSIHRLPSGDLLAMLRAIPGQGAYLVRVPSGEIEILGAPTMLPRCRIGRHLFPYALCHGRVSGEHLLATALHAPNLSGQSSSHGN